MRSLLQPLVNLALNMQIQAWQQVSAAAAAHQLPMVMEQMHMVAQQQVGWGRRYAPCLTHLLPFRQTPS